MKRLMKKRSLAVDYEELSKISECFIYIAMVHLMLRQLGYVKSSGCF